MWKVGVFLQTLILLPQKGEKAARDRGGGSSREWWGCVTSAPPPPEPADAPEMKKLRLEGLAMEQDQLTSSRCSLEAGFFAGASTPQMPAWALEQREVKNLREQL